MPRPSTGQVVEPKAGRAWAIRFRAYGKRRYLALGTTAEGWNRQRAEAELRHVLADVERGIWQPHEPAVEAPAEIPTFHAFASEWMLAREPELRPATISDYRNRLTNHLLPFFADYRLDAIGIEDVDRYRTGKVRAGKISAEMINKTLVLLGAVLELAVEYGHLDRNPAKGKRRRLRVERPAAVYLDTAEQIATLLEAAGDLDSRPDSRTEGRRPLVAVLVLAGLRISEACALRWRDVDLATGRLTVRHGSKTAAGQRHIDLLPLLRDELLEHRARVRPDDPEAPVFVTARGRQRDRTNARQRVILPVIERANELLAGRELAPLPEGLTAHKLRHTFASLLAACGEDPAYVMAQIGHTDPQLTLRVYTHQMRRRDGEKDRLRALVGGADWAAMGSEGAQEPLSTSEAGIGPEAESRMASEGLSTRPEGFEPSTSRSGGGPARSPKQPKNRSDKR